MPYTPPTPTWIGPLDPSVDIIAGPTDGEMELAWGSKLQRIYKGYYPQMVSNALSGLYNRGVVSDGFVLDHAKLSKAKGLIGTLELEWQSIGGYLNPDEWSLTPEDLAPRIERHPHVCFIECR